MVLLFLLIFICMTMYNTMKIHAYYYKITYFNESELQCENPQVHCCCILGVRAICEGKQVESTTARGLIHKWDKVDIYSNSWGFYGQGKYVVELDHLTGEAFVTGTTKVKFSTL